MSSVIASAGVTGCLLTSVTLPVSGVSFTTMKPAAEESSSSTESIVASLKFSSSVPPGCVVTCGPPLVALRVVGAVGVCWARSRMRCSTDRFGSLGSGMAPAGAVVACCVVAGATCASAGAAASATANAEAANVRGAVGRRAEKCVMCLLG